MSKKHPSKLLDSSDEEEQSDLTFKANTDYANKYDDWRAKEEMQKLKDKYGDEPVSASSSESEDEDAEALTPAIERDFFKTMAVLKSKDPGVYDKNRKFFIDEPEPAASSSGKLSSSKPMFLKDYERKIITEENGVIDETKNRLPPKFQSEYDRQQEEAKRNLTALIHDDSDEEDNGLLVKRNKTQEQLQQEEHDYANWLKGVKKEEEGQAESLSALKPLKDYWTDPSLDDGEKFLRDYILDRKYIDKDAKRIPTYSEIIEEHLSEDEADIDKAEEFEQKYNFRFEEPDQEFIKRFPRTMDDSLRRKDDSRKKKRDEIKERKEAENNRMREEIKQLKSLKRREILQKIAKLKSIAGNEDLSVEEKDLEGDFDPDTYDNLMQKAFDEEYYQNEEETEKPELSEESDIDENWLEEREVEEHDDDVAEGTDTSEKPARRLAEENQPSTSTAVPERKGKRRRRTKVSEALQNAKPVFDPNDKKLEAYLDEYYKLDFEDVVSGIPCRFKYRSVVPNNFGLSVEEILRAPDRELNAWCSLKKTVQYRSEQEEMHDVRAFKQKGSQQELKQKIIPSLVEEGAEEKEEAQPEQKKKRRRKKKKNMKTGTEDEQGLDSDGTRKVKAEDTDASSGELNTPAKEAGTPSVSSLTSTNAENTSHEKKRKRKKKSKKTPEPSAGSLNGPKNKKVKSEDYNAFIKTLPSAKISDKRLEAYGLNPKKFRQKEKYVLLSKRAGGPESKPT